MADQPTLLGSLPPADPDTAGWEIIDRATWEKLASLMGLPPAARLDLVHIVRTEQIARGWRGHGPERPSDIRKKLKSLHTLAEKLATQLTALGDGARSALTIASLDEDRFRRSPLLRPSGEPDPLDMEIEAIERWRDRLGRACTVAAPWHAESGPDRSLRLMVAELDALLLRHTGEGLARASVPTKHRGGRAGRCWVFINAVVSLVFSCVSAGTLDDALKDVIEKRRAEEKRPARRRKVGRS